MFLFVICHIYPNMMYINICIIHTYICIIHTHICIIHTHIVIPHNIHTHICMYPNTYTYIHIFRYYLWTVWPQRRTPRACCNYCNSLRECVLPSHNSLISLRSPTKRMGGGQVHVETMSGNGWRRPRLQLVCFFSVHGSCDSCGSWCGDGAIERVC